MGKEGGKREGGKERGENGKEGVSEGGMGRKE